MLSKDLVLKLARFGVVGLAVMVVFAGLNAVFGLCFGWGKYTAFWVAYPLALLMHFLLNKYWTFKQAGKTSEKQVGEYLLMVAVTWVVQSAVFAYIVARWPTLPGWVAAPIASAAQMALSFVFMQKRVFAAKQVRDPSTGGARAADPWVTILVIGGVLFSYAWIICPTWEGWAHPDRSADYYNLEVHGLMKGHLYMDVAMPKNLPPFKVGVLPKGTPFYLDASYYQHHYYLYFGIAPLLTLFLPFRLLSGQDLPASYAILIQSSVGFLLLVASLAALRRRFFPKTTTLLWAMAILAAGLSTGIAPSIRRALMYEISTTASFMYGLGLLGCLLRADLSRRPKWWLALGSLCGGLVFASRPNAGLAAAVVLPFAAHWFSLRRGKSEGSSFIGWYLACGLPAFFCLSLVLAFNAARFGSPLDFGHAYQVGSDSSTFTSVRYIWQNLKVYYLLPPNLSWYFPFISPGLEGPKPLGYIGLEEASGQYLFVPLVLVGLFALFVLRPKKVAEPVRLFCWAGLLWFTVNFAVLCAVSARANRYLLDAQPALAALACVGLLAVSGHNGGRRWLATAAGCWAVLSGVCNLLESCETESLFEFVHPSQFHAMADVLNKVTAPIQAAMGRPTGTQAFEITFGSGKIDGRTDPLIYAGSPTRADHLELIYMSETSGYLTFVHGPYGRVSGKLFHFNPGESASLVVQAPTFFPPLGHPSYGDMPTWEQVYLRGHLKVTLAGAVVLEGDCPGYEAMPNLNYLGRRGDLEGTAERFLGTLTYRGAVPVDRPALDGLREVKGPLSLSVVLPRDRFRSSEPLVVVGEPGNYNMFGVEYTDPTHVRLFFTAADEPAIYSSPIAIDYMAVNRFDVLFAGLDRDREGGLKRIRLNWEVWLNGREVLNKEIAQCSVCSGDVFIGGKPWLGGNVSRPMFGGWIYSSHRIGDAQRNLALFEKTGLFEADMVMPPKNMGQSEPVLIVGKAGDADGLFVQYLSDHSLRFGLDRWNISEDFSKPIDLDMGLRHDLRVAYGPRLAPGSPGRGDWTVWLDGKQVFATPTVAPARSPAYLGKNPIGMSTSQPAFTGRFESEEPAR